MLDISDQILWLKSIANNAAKNSEATSAMHRKQYSVNAKNVLMLGFQVNLLKYFLLKTELLNR